MTSVSSSNDIKQDAFIFAGYCAKKMAASYDWLKVPHVTHIASISECMSPFAPYDMSETGWQWNEHFFYGDETKAEAAIPHLELDLYDLFAYKLYPECFTQEGPKAIAGIRPIQISESLSESYDFLGYDIVGRGTDVIPSDQMFGYGCSPLSCNGMAQDILVNAYCLIDKLEEVLKTAEWFGRYPESHVEPATYYLFQVWKKRTKLGV